MPQIQPSSSRLAVTPPPLVLNTAAPKQLQPDSVWCAGVKPPTQASVPGLDRPKERSAAAVKPAARSSSHALEAATPSKRQRVVGAYQSTLLFPRGACLYCTYPDTCIVSVGLSLLDTPALLNRGFSLGN